MQVIVRASGGKGLVKRSPREELALRVRILRGRHLADVYGRVVDELGDRADTIGPIDMSRNTLRSYVSRLARAYLVPPLVEDLGEALAGLIGDMTAKTTQARYAKAKGRPMPTRMSMVSAEVQRFRIGANFCGTLIGWSEGTQRPYLEVITPDDLECDYRSDDPIMPTVIRHFRRRVLAGKEVEVAETYDLTDPEQPSYRVMDGEKERTEEALGQTYEGDQYWWRYANGKPFHRIVISGNPREPYCGVELVEGTLKMGALYTHWGAGIRDAGHPQRNAIGLHLTGLDTDAETGQAGAAFGPETVAQWHHDDPERPGSLHQWGPGFDPEVTGRAIRTYELGLLAALGLPVDYEATGGEPTATEAAALAELVASTYADCRGHDALVLRRVAATHNRASALTEGMEPTAIPEAALPVLYREEIDQALTDVENPKKPGDPNA